ncbi:MAG: alpha-amylase family glycosyl hydrolase, partial [Saprospiraceae bacterium]
MKKIQLLGFLLFCFGLRLSAQVTCDPVFPTVTDQVTIYFHADQGNMALKNVNGTVYMHTGVITNQSTSPSDWKHVMTTWGVADPVGAMTLVSPNLYKKTLTINTFYGIAGGETVLKMAFVFRNQDGSKVGRAADGSDIYYDVSPANSPLLTTLVQPTAALLLAAGGSPIVVQGSASKTAELRLLDNGNQVAGLTGQSLNFTLTAGLPGLHHVEFIATTGGESDTSAFNYLVPAPITGQDLPAGSKPGITYLDGQSVRLVLYAPNKQVVHVTGDFNDWLPTAGYQMNRTTDGTTWWLDLTGLNPGQIYRFQYLVDGALRIADPLSTLVLDASNDPYIPASTYPDLPAYPTGKTSGAVSVLQTAQAPFNWQASNYQRPKKTDLVIYELLLRDFVAAHDFQTVLDSLDYLEKLGVTAIELMPVNEFDGNISWGYNPAFHKALDKYYGTAESLKMLVDACHQRNMAVILDVVFNQASGASPLAQLYWDAINNRPAADNPWLNPTAKHDFNVFNDFNHESQPTKVYVKNCLDYWLTEFNVDGFRFDLSKGFTQKNTLGNVGAWGQYDASRIAILKDYANFIWGTDATAYVILEHFADNTEEKELAEYGMMPWGNMRGAYKDVALGFSSTPDLSGISYKQRGWSVPNLVGYFESHDEERIGYECLAYGNNQSSTYNVRWLPVFERRIELLNNLFYPVPGPKMLWQFGELAYDFSIRQCQNGSFSDNCRTDPKPIRWDYYSDPYRRRLFDITAALLHLRQSYDVFETTDFQLNIGSGNGRTIRLNSPGMNVHVVANIATSQQTVSPNFQHTGTWYEYYSGATKQVTNVTEGILLAPGDYRLYTDQFVPLPPGLNTTPTVEIAGLLSGLEVYPNPTAGLF